MARNSTLQVAAHEYDRDIAPTIKYLKTASNSPSELDITSFLERCDAFRSSQPAATRNVLRAGYVRLKEGFDQLQDTRLKENAARAPTFNIFKLLRLENDEIRLHSKLIGHFLNPRGSHGQGTLFLDAFISCLKTIPLFPLTFPATPSTRAWRISTERFTIKGNLDIVLEGRKDGIICVIENKVLAGEGREQLSRYRDWLDLYPEFPLRLLLFLTPEGRLAETISDENAYLRLSYAKHIRVWLEQTIGSIQAPDVKVTAKQYLAIVQGLV